MKKKFLILFVLIISIFPAFSESKFFYYLNNPHFKADTSFGLTVKNYNLKNDGIKYKQTQLSLDIDILYLPTAKHLAFIGGFDVKVPLKSVRKYNGDKNTTKNFKTGIYTTLSPYLVGGYSFKLKNNPRFSFVAATGFKYDQSKIRDLDDNKQHIRTISWLLMANARYEIKGRYKLLFSIKEEIGLKHWVEKTSYKASSSGFTAQFGISYDF